MQSKMWLNIRQLTDTANLKIIDAHYHDFNSKLGTKNRWKLITGVNYFEIGSSLESVSRVLLYSCVQSNWGLQNSFQQFLVPAYYRRTIENNETDH